MNIMIQSPTRKMSWAGTMKVPHQEAEQEANQERERENQARGRGEVRCMGGCREDPGRISLAVLWTTACAEEGRGGQGDGGGASCGNQETDMAQTRVAAV